MHPRAGSEGLGFRLTMTLVFYSVLLISSHFEHHGSVSVARAQYICIGHGPRSRFRGVRSEMKSTVQRFSHALKYPVMRWCSVWEPVRFSQC